MAKKFKAKKKWVFKKSKYIFYFILITVIATFTFNYIYHIKFATGNEQFIQYLLEDSNHFKTYNSSVKKIVYKLSHVVSGIDVNEPKTLLETNFLFKKQPESQKKLVYNKNQSDLEKSVENLDPQEEQKTKPLIYIYSTHQTEGYAAGNLTEFGIQPDVMMAAYLLQDRLNKLGVDVMIEERKMSDYLKQNNLDYNQSYTASRYYASDVIQKTPQIDLVIDLHRDALAKNLSTVTIDNKNYAKILFVLGGKASTYQKNLSKVTHLNGKIKEKYPTLTRGLLARESSVYNQDLTDHSILLELGGNENSVDEVMNTVEALAPILSEFVGELHGK